MNLHISLWLYAAACMLLPVVWGVLMVWATNRLQAFLKRRRGADPERPVPTPPEYYI